MEAIAKCLVGLALVAFMVTISGVIFALPLMLLWNALLPSIFGFKVLTFWQAFGMNLLTGILFRPKSSSSKEEEKTNE